MRIQSLPVTMLIHSAQYQATCCAI